MANRNVTESHFGPNRNETDLFLGPGMRPNHILSKIGRRQNVFGAPECDPILFDAPEQDRITNMNETKYKFRKRKYILHQFFFKFQTQNNLNCDIWLVFTHRALLVH
jgi:hypothetical protein